MKHRLTEERAAQMNAVQAAGERGERGERFESDFHGQRVSISRAKSRLPEVSPSRDLPPEWRSPHTVSTSVTDAT